MRKLFRKALLAVSLFYFAGNSAMASHVQGGEITYTCLAPNTYRVTLKYFTDCSGATVGNSETVKITAGGCNPGRSFTVTKTGETFGDPYCAAVGNLCNGQRLNNRVTTYSGTFTLTAAEAACPDWTVSGTVNARPELVNLVNPQGDLYVEANLKLSAANNSAVVNPHAPSVEIVCYKQETNVNLNASDPDCDSLSYELVAPLSAAGVPYQYRPTQLSSTNFFINPNPPSPFCNTCTPPNPQMGLLQNFPASYSPTFPLLSVNANWNAVNPATGAPYQTVITTPYFNLDPASGMLGFRPVQFTTGGPAFAVNHYNITVKISEWRKVNGAIIKVGTVLRDMTFIVQDCGSNVNPEVTSITANGQQIQPGSIVTVRPGAPLNLQLATSDLNGDTLTLDTDATTVLSGATFNQSSAAFPTGSISWVAPAGNPPCGVRYFYVRVRDNFCPLRGKKVYVIGVRVSNAGTATGIAGQAKNNLHFTAFPNPFSDRVNFRFDGATISGNAQLLIFNSLGQEIDRITVPAGTSEVEWKQASRFPAGTYVARLLSENQPNQTLKFIRLR